MMPQSHLRTLAARRPLAEEILDLELELWTLFLQCVVSCSYQEKMDSNMVSMVTTQIDF